MHHRAQRLGRVHHQQRAAGNSEVTGLGKGLQHPTVHGRGDTGIALRQCRLARAGCCLIALCLGRLVLGVSGVKCCFADESLRLQVAGAFHLGLGIAQLGIGLVNLGLGALATYLRLAVVNRDHHLTSPYFVAGFDGKCGNAPCGLRRNGALLHSLNYTVQYVAIGSSAGLHGGGGDGGALRPTQAGSGGKKA